MDRRHEIISPYIKDKEVLDLGVGDISDRFLHRFIADQAKGALGIELDETRAETLKKMGYQVEKADVTDFNLNRKFDTVIAGDLIEHLTNFDGFFNSIYNHLKDEGFLILNTPNIYAINFLLRGFVGRPGMSDEHTCGFDEQLLRQLLAKYEHHFELSQLIYYNFSDRTFRNRLLKFLSLFSHKWRANLLVICKKVNHS